MDSQKKERLKKEYQYMSDDEIIELALTSKNEFEEGVYEIVLGEFRKRDLQKKIAEREKQKRLQIESSGEDLATIAQFSQGAEAYIMRGRLETEGIGCFIADEHLISINWLYSNAIGGVKLQVKKSDIEKAKKILAEKSDIKFQYRKGGGESRYVCPHCNSEDVYFEKYSRKAYIWSWLLLGIPIPFLKRRWKCYSCSHEWKK